MLHDHFRAERIFSEWRVRPCFGEPTNAYFARLVYDSLDCLPETYAKKTGIWISREKWQVLLQSLLNLPLTDAEKASLVRWSPVETQSRYWGLGGENLTMTLVKPGGTYCPACIEEAEYHRVWWDLKGFQICPVHDCAMEANPSRHDRRWPFYGICLKKVEAPPKLSLRGKHSLEGYILQRLKVVDHIVDRPLLDHHALDSVMGACSILGGLLACGTTKIKPRALPSFFSVGFDALCRDENHLTGKLAAWLERNYSKENLKRVGMGHYGFARTFSQSRKAIVRSIFTAQVKACARVGTLNPKLRAVPGVVAPVLRSNLPGILGVTDYSAILLLRRRGFDTKQGSGELVEIPDTVVAQLREEIDRSASLAEAAALMGCSAEDAGYVAVKLAKAGWSPCIQIRRGRKIIRHYIWEELERYCDIIQSLPPAPPNLKSTGIFGRVTKQSESRSRLMANVILGRELAYVDPEKPGLLGLRFVSRRYGGKPSPVGHKAIDDDTMLWSEFRAMTGVDSAGIQRLIALGVLEPSVAKGVTRTSALAFHERYISPVRYLQGQGRVMSSAIKVLEKYDFELAFASENTGVTLVRREHFSEKMGEIFQPPRSILDLWPPFVAAASRNSPSLMVPRVPGDGMFDIGPSSRLLSIKAVLRDDGIWVGSDFHPHYRRMWKIFCSREREICESLRSLKIERKGERVAVSATAGTIQEIERITIDLGKFNEFFRNKRP